MSSWAKSNFFWASSEEKARAHRRSGISFEISVACLRDVTFTAESHQNSLRDPCGALAPWFHLVLHSVKLRLRSGWHAGILLVICFCLVSNLFLSSIIPLLFLVVKKNRLTETDPKRRKKAQNERTCMLFCHSFAFFCASRRTIFATFLDKRAFYLYNGRRNEKRKENRQCTRKLSAIWWNGNSLGWYCQLCSVLFSRVWFTPLFLVRREAKLKEKTRNTKRLGNNSFPKPLKEERWRGWLLAPFSFACSLVKTSINISRSARIW